MHLPAAGKCQSTPDDIAMPDGLDCVPCFCCYQKKSSFAFFPSLHFFFNSCSVSESRSRVAVCLHAPVAVYSVVVGVACVRLL